MCKISVIIPNYNRADAIELTLLALAKQTLEGTQFEVIVVDDGSTDCSLEIVAKQTYPYNLSLYKQMNRGAGEARNLGVEKSKAELLVFLDIDMIAEPNLLEEYLNSHREHEDALLIGRQKPWPSAYQTHLDQTVKHEWFQDLGPEPFEPSFFHVLSGSMAMHREIFDLIGGFDKNVGTGKRPATEDTEFGYRATLRGIELIYCPRALAYHNHPRMLVDRGRKEFSTAFWTARMFKRYPEMTGSLPFYQDVRPIRWTKDRPVEIMRKTKRNLASRRPVSKIINSGLSFTERYFPNNTRLLQHLYWGLIGIYRFRGFRAGMNYQEDAHPSSRPSLNYDI